MVQQLTNITLVFSAINNQSAIRETIAARGGDADDTFLAHAQHNEDTLKAFNADLSCEQVQTCSSF